MARRQGLSDHITDLDVLKRQVQFLSLVTGRWIYKIRGKKKLYPEKIVHLASSVFRLASQELKSSLSV